MVRDCVAEAQNMSADEELLAAHLPPAVCTPQVSGTVMALKAHQSICPAVSLF